MWTHATLLKFCVVSVFLFFPLQSYGTYVHYTVPTVGDDCRATNTEELAGYVQDFHDSGCIGHSLPSCCLLLVTGGAESGVYKIEDTNVYCDVNGGWMTFMKRSRNLNKKKFKQNWKRYSRRKGFGALHEDHWVGLDLLHKLTQSYNMELRIDLWNTKNSEPKVTLNYDAFYVGGPEEFYQLTLGTFSGPHLLDGFSVHNNSKFSTPIIESAGLHSICAKQNGGGWWYTDCYRFLPTGIERPILGKEFIRFNSVEMKIRPRDCEEM